MAIHSCLEAEVGAVAGGRRGQALINAVDEALGELLDKRRKPRGRFKELQERRSARPTEVAELEEKLGRVLINGVQNARCPPHRQMWT